jgi:hypothetical protein
LPLCAAAAEVNAMKLNAMSARFMSSPLGWGRLW